MAQTPRRLSHPSMAAGVGRTADLPTSATFTVTGHSAPSPATAEEGAGYLPPPMEQWSEDPVLMSG